MANSKFQEIYQLLTDYDFQVDIFLYSDLICTICGKILNRPYQSPCGCRYCFLCVKEHLKAGNKCCPKPSDECREQCVDIDNNLQFDHFANKNILAIKVKCPEKACDTKTELRNMTEHMKSHSINCPFNDMGCNHSNLKSQAIAEHMMEESYSHTILLMEYIKNMKNEIEILRENLQKKEKTIGKLQNQLRNNTIQHSKEIARMKNDISLLKNVPKSGSTNDLPTDLIQINQDGTICSSTEEESVHNTESDAGSHFSGTRQSRYLTSRSTLRSISANQEIAPFEWKIDDFMNRVKDAKSKMSKVIYSKPFYSHRNGYKLRLRINPNGFGQWENTHLSVFFSLIEGESDDSLFWPMEQQVVIGLIDQVTNKIHVSDKYRLKSVEKDFQVIFHKPSTRTEIADYYFYGTPTFINLNLLFNNGKLLKNGAILLKCFIK